LVSGASGLVGSALCNALASDDTDVGKLTRRTPQSPEQIQWTPGKPLADEAWEGTQALVHLAGENVAGGRWNNKQKARIRDSRIGPTRALCEGIARLKRPPETLVCASAIGFYGDQGDSWLDENSPQGQGFLAQVCAEWEAACAPAREAGVRVVNMRFGIVLSTEGGALAKMLPLFRWGLGGRLGSGDQYMSWIGLDDVVGALQHALANTTLDGPVNTVAPNPVTNREFTGTLAKALGRPALLPAPKFGLRMALGREMANEMLLASARVKPARLLESDFGFKSPKLEQALQVSLKS